VLRAAVWVALSCVGLAAVASAADGELRLVDGGLKVRFQGSQVVGRAESCSLNLAGLPEDRYTQLSRIHAALVEQDGQWSAVDLGSTNGTFVNEAPLLAWKPAPIKDGDRLRLAGFAFTFHTPKDSALPVGRFDPARAQKACTAGSAPDCTVLGVAYHSGIGLAKDLTRARAAFQQACTAGYEPACRAPR
jgi:hypothetical protein